ncbi:flagellar hook-basal body complex protein [Suilimivivens aceti]|uniref:Flagellar hook protein FlgE n=1 Tax=Suilimivivens aceti TaxID=2981774 RepID=A0ABT2T071_9FIRM|nr:flagellar hook-basal body complex protein [Suilimivivens aceti]MCU6743648.1 flagellar hook-basal body complex protein [Suilimivivens aceti]SCH32761.1 Flagellar hook protein flgE [uncultured Clostridium sp.]
MMRSLYSGVAGLKTHQTRMDVIGNNIANVNTTAYKSQSMTFSDLMYQTTQAASGANPTTGVGGINARQIGLGAKTSAIKTAITTQGASQTTNDPFDIMITGDSFFIVNNGQNNYFTRDGSFYVDGAGNLAMTSTGYNVMGWKVDPNDASAIKQDTVSALRIMTTENMTYPPEATKSARISGIIDKNDTNVNAAAGKIMNLEFYDNQGYKYTAKLSVHSTTTDGTFTVQLDDILDSKGKTVLADKTKASLQQNNTNVTAPVLEFDLKNGSFKNVGTAGGTESTLTLHFDTGTFPSFTDITIDFSKCSNLNNNGSSTVSPIRGDAKGNGAGRKVGEMSGIEIQKDGMIYANYDNGCSRLLGQIAVATFANASGLAKEGDNLYSATQNSGDFDGIGKDITTGGGYMNTGVLEMSNVDLSSEFTEMITTQRGFQANSRIITVSDTLLEELTNLKR